jgi:hypothetical protein
MDKDDYITELIASAHKSAQSLEQTRRARDCLFCGGDDNLIFDEFLDDYVCESCRLKLSKTSLPTTDLRTHTPRISTVVIMTIHRDA